MKPKAGFDPLLEIPMVMTPQTLFVGHPFASVVTPLAIQRPVQVGMATRHRTGGLGKTDIFCVREKA